MALENNNSPTTLIIFGATGDLARTKLFPSLYHLEKNGYLPQVFTIIAVGRRNYSTDEFLTIIESELKEKFKYTYHKDIWERFIRHIIYFNGDFEQDETYTKLAEKINFVDNTRGLCTHKLFYMAISPDQFETVAKGIKKTQLLEVCKNEKMSKIIVEKPFGSSLDTFNTLNGNLLNLFDESQIYRIDHLLGKETVQNILYFRLANSALDPAIDANFIESVEINYLESNGVGSRGNYYDKYGQMRDMLQSHMLQLFALTLMDIPLGLDPVLLAQNKTKIIEGLHIKDVTSDVVRGQYTKGVVEGKTCIGYLEEKDIPEDSKTETFFQVKAVLNNDKWHNTPVIFTSGKRLNRKSTEVVINYKEVCKLPGLCGANKLIFRIQPEEGIVLKIRVKKPGTDEIEDVDMSFNYKDSFPGLLGDAYEYVLLDIIRTRNLFNITTPELEASWKFVEPILYNWTHNPESLKLYPAGSDELRYKITSIL